MSKNKKETRFKYPVYMKDFFFAEPRAMKVVDSDQPVEGW